MTARAQIMLGTLMIAVLVGSAPVAVMATDGADVSAAASQVQRGASQIGQGKILEGTGETAKGIGNTVVESVKYTGQRLQDAGRAAKPAATTAWEQTKEGAVAFGTGVQEFFADLFQ